MGLEFRAVAVMAYDNDVIPLQERVESVGDEADLEEVYNTERHLLYVAYTRARDHVLVTKPARRRVVALDDANRQLRRAKWQLSLSGRVPVIGTDDQLLCAIHVSAQDRNDTRRAK